MSLEDFKKNLMKIKETSEDYERLTKNKKNVELDIQNLKAKYRENRVERDVFSEYNKKLQTLNQELSEIREQVLKLCRKNSEILMDEMKNVF